MIFPLKKKFAEDFGLKFKDVNGKEHLVSAGCYGLGTTRAMGAAVEAGHDERGIIWPAAIAPFQVHLMEVGESLKAKKAAEKLYSDLIAKNTEALYDDRAGKTAGEKFADSDLLGIPLRVVVSEKTLAKDGVELKERNSETIRLETIKTFLEKYD